MEYNEHLVAERMPERKVSTLSQRSTTARTDFVDTQIGISKMDLDIYTTMFRGLKEAWESGQMTSTTCELHNKLSAIYEQNLRGITTSSDEP